MTFQDAFEETLNRFGFIVIGWNPKTGDFATGDDVKTVWGETHAPPAPVRVVGPARRSEWTTQVRFLISQGAPFENFLKPPPRWRYSRIKPVNGGGR